MYTNCNAWGLKKVPKTLCRKKNKNWKTARFARGHHTYQANYEPSDQYLKNQLGNESTNALNAKCMNYLSKTTTAHTTNILYNKRKTTRKHLHNLYECREKIPAGWEVLLE